MKRIAYAFAMTANIFVLCAMVAIGAYSISSAKAAQEAAREMAIVTARLDQISDEDRYCLQQNIYFESRDQSTLGQRAVAWVTLNRMEARQFPNTVCDVVWQDSQFSWTHDGKPDRPGTNAVEQRAWNRAATIANLVINRWANGADSPVGEALYFHATNVHPRWRHDFDRVAMIDGHIFYKP